MGEQLDGAAWVAARPLIRTYRWNLKDTIRLVAFTSLLALMHWNARPHN